MHLERLNGAVPRLRDLQGEQVLTARNAAQQSRFAQLVDRRNELAKVLAEFQDKLATYANALAEAAALKDEENLFNHKPVKGVLINPKDEMVSHYPYLPPIVPEVILGGTRLVSADGTLLYTPSSKRVSSAPASVSSNVSSRDPLNEQLQHAKDMQVYDTQQLQSLRQSAAIRRMDVEHVANAEGINDQQLKRIQDSVDGEMVREAERQISIGKPTS
jgi:hypothetical protein